MSTLTAPGIPVMAPGEVRRSLMDWGENTASEKTGKLMAGDTVASCTVSVYSKPTGASDPTLSSVTVPTQTSPADDINNRAWSTGEATLFTITMGSSQTVGEYWFKQIATTTNGETLIGFSRVRVSAT